MHWVAWFNYDDKGFIEEAGIDTEHREYAGILETKLLTATITCENDREKWNAILHKDMALMEAAPQALDVFKRLLEFWDNGTPVSPGALLVTDVRKLVARMEHGPLGFTPQADCENCGGTGVRSHNPLLTCHPCRVMAILMGEIPGTIDGVAYVDGRPVEG